MENKSAQEAPNSNDADEVSTYELKEMLASMNALVDILGESVKQKDTLPLWSATFARFCEYLEPDHAICMLKKGEELQSVASYGFEGESPPCAQIQKASDSLAWWVHDIGSSLIVPNILSDHRFKSNEMFEVKENTRIIGKVVGNGQEVYGIFLFFFYAARVTLPQLHGTLDKLCKLLAIVAPQLFTKINTIETAKRLAAETQMQLFQSQKLAALGEMLASMAHEMNQPLAGISLTVQMIELLKSRNMLTDVTLADMLQKITASVERCDKVVKHVRAYARQDDEKSGRFCVDSTIESALILMGESLRIQGIEVSKTLNAPDIQVSGYSSQLEQVWINMLGNSRDALDEMDVESKTVHIPYAKKLTISSKVEGDRILVEIADNGIGMTEEIRKKTFEPFFTTKPVGKGTGLGMTILYGILKVHDAEIDIQSEPKKGTTITVRIPLLPKMPE